MMEEEVTLESDEEEEVSAGCKGNKKEEEKENVIRGGIDMNVEIKQVMH